MAMFIQILFFGPPYMCIVYVGIIYSMYNVDGGRSNVLTPASVIMIKMDCENISTKFHT